MFSRERLLFFWIFSKWGGEGPAQIFCHLFKSAFLVLLRYSKDEANMWNLGQAQGTQNTHCSKLLSEVCFLSDHLPPRKEVGGRESRGQRVLASESPLTLLCLVTLLIKLELMCGLCKALTRQVKIPISRNERVKTKYDLTLDWLLQGLAVN